jgi:electron transfer flavoprotein beta subunit
MHNSIVLVKQVPDTSNISGKVMKDDGTVNRSKLSAIFNFEDKVALEFALQIKDKCGGKVTAVTMGPPRASDILRECLYMGADEAYLITDRKFAGADTLATSYVLSEAIKKIGNYSFVFAGRQAIDGDTAQVGPQTAEKLGLPQITCVSRIDSLEAASGGAGDRDPGDRAPGTARTITATRSIEGGYETLRALLPALLTVTSEANEPRPPSVKLVLTYKGIAAETMPEYDDSYLDPASDAAEVCLIDPDGRPRCRAKVLQWDADAIGADEAWVGLRGSPTRVKDIESVVLAQADARMVAPTEAGVAELVRELIAEHILG